MPPEAEAKAKAKAPAAPELMLLVLSAGMPGEALAVALDGLKTSSKAVGSHKRRELFWSAYSKMISATSSLTGAAHCFLLCRTLPSAARPVSHSAATACTARSALAYRRLYVAGSGRAPLPYSGPRRRTPRGRPAHLRLPELCELVALRTHEESPRRPDPSVASRRRRQPAPRPRPRTLRLPAPRPPAARLRSRSNCSS